MFSEKELCQIVETFKEGLKIPCNRPEIVNISNILSVLCLHSRSAAFLGFILLESKHESMKCCPLKGCFYLLYLVFTGPQKDQSRRNYQTSCGT